MASRGQDIVDSWEEIDEERLASRLNQLASDDPAAKLPDCLAGASSSGTPSASNSLPAMLDEELRPRMILQRPQQMQILRRPQSKVQEAEKAAAESKPKTQIKSLDQRKQEYAEARLRILGSAHDEEEQQQKQQVEQAKKGSPNTNGYRINSNTNNNVRLERPPPNSYRPAAPPQPVPFFAPHLSGRNQQLPEGHYYQQQQAPPHPGAYHFQHHQKQQLPAPYGMHPQNSGFHHIPHQGTAAMAAGATTSGYAIGHSSNNNVLRLPAGPDGSHGFTMRR